MFKKIFAFLIIFNCAETVAMESCDQPRNLGKLSYVGLTRTLQNDSDGEIKNSVHPRKNQRFSFMHDVINDLFSIFNFFKPSEYSDSRNNREDESAPVNFPALSKEDIEGIDLSKIKLDYFYTDSEKDDDEN
jgi:hypothetical protein